MKRYLEIKEELTKEERIVSEPEFIRVEVADEAEARQRKEELEPLLKGKKKSCMHEHNHSLKSEENRPCTIKELKKK